MYFNILKKDLKRKKSMNIILFVFIVLCTTFMAGSVNNLFTTTNALDYFKGISNTSDYFIITQESELTAQTSEEAEAWVSSSKYVSEYEKEIHIVVPTDKLVMGNGDYKDNGTTVLVKAPDTFNLILDSSDNPITSISNGEIAIPYTIAKNNNLSVGDTITIAFEGREKTLTLTCLAKDMAFGSSYMSYTRLLISDEDFEYLRDSDEAMTCSLYSIMSEDTTALEKDLNRQTFPIIVNFRGSLLDSTYLMEMMVAGILIIVSICLIIIALVILRFTIAFTLQEDYREIGIMKAIGLKNGGIKRLYIVKYLSLAVIGAAAGVLISIPFGNMLTEDVKHSMAMESAAGNLFINILCGCVVVLLVVVFCYLSANKLNKFTAIQAIRNGATGERYKSKGFYKLHRHRKTPVALQMATNDIFSNLKSYMVLVITFILGTLLVILPLNAVNTLKSDSIVEHFGVAKSDVFIDNYKTASYVGNGNLMISDAKALEGLYKENGLDITLHVEYGFTTRAYTDDPDDSHTITAYKSHDYEASNYNFFINGTAPVLSNEIAMTEISMEQLGVTIGDSVNISIGDTTQSYIITGSFQSMNNMGESFRFSSAAEIDLKYVSAVFTIQGDFTDRENIEGQIEKLKEITPDYEVSPPQEYVSKYIGASLESMDSLKSLILVVVLFINCLITVLLTRTFITKDEGEIALLKNIGFRNRTVRAWQVLRIIIVLFVSIALGVLLSSLINPVMVKYTFGLMGAKSVKVHIIAAEVYLLYPLVLFAGTGIAAILSTGRISKINLSQIGNIE